MLEAEKPGMNGKDYLNYLILQEVGGYTVKEKWSQMPSKGNKGIFYSVILQYGRSLWYETELHSKYRKDC